jgi:hypothetical protein
MGFKLLYYAILYDASKQTVNSHANNATAKIVFLHYMLRSFPLLSICIPGPVWNYPNTRHARMQLQMLQIVMFWRTCALLPYLHICSHTSRKGACEAAAASGRSASKPSLMHTPIAGGEGRRCREIREIASIVDKKVRSMCVDRR